MRLPILEPSLRDLEAAYREHFLAQDRQTTSLVAATTLVGFLPFAISDFRLFGAGPLFLALLSLRVGYSALAVWFLWRLTRVSTAPIYERLTLAWALACAAAILVVNATRPPAYFLSSALDLLALVVIYLFVPNRLAFRVLPALLLTAGELAIATWLRPPATVTLSAVWATFIGANALGLIASVRLNRFRRAQFQARVEEARIRQELQLLANTDALTGVPNRRRFFALAIQEFERQRRYRRPLTLLVLDIDHFKHVNDDYGHQVGDSALHDFAQLIATQKRAQDIFGRLGGEEFALLLPETTVAAARIMAERLLARCAALELATPRGPVRISFSAGLSAAAPEDRTFDELLYRADQALYQAKANGRNRIEIYQPADQPA